ncbi:hypothetical protein BDZ89DRAFT_1138975 [Hymenopellis radicata]|nr:hypothetical protein BDZ89DRAFT_1138975 [Hymenopellis radicata]
MKNELEYGDCLDFLATELLEEIFTLAMTDHREQPSIQDADFARKKYPALVRYIRRVNIRGCGDILVATMDSAGSSLSHVDALELEVVDLGVARQCRPFSNISTLVLLECGGTARDVHNFITGYDAIRTLEFFLCRFEHGWLRHLRLPENIETVRADMGGWADDMIQSIDLCGAIGKLVTSCPDGGMEALIEQDEPVVGMLMKRYAVSADRFAVRFTVGLPWDFSLWERPVLPNLTCLKIQVYFQSEVLRCATSFLERLKAPGLKKFILQTDVGQMINLIDHRCWHILAKAVTSMGVRAEYCFLFETFHFGGSHMWSTSLRNLHQERPICI